MAKGNLIKPVRNSFVGSVSGLSLYSEKDVCPFDHQVCKRVCICVSWKYVGAFRLFYPMWTMGLCDRFVFRSVEV
jgi:hypothetical protein